jgi:hypothetical protein
MGNYEKQRSTHPIFGFWLRHNDINYIQLHRAYLVQKNLSITRILGGIISALTEELRSTIVLVERVTLSLNHTKLVIAIHIDNNDKKFTHIMTGSYYYWSNKQVFSQSFAFEQFSNVFERLSI